MTELAEIRKAAGWSRERAAVTAGVSTHLCHLYEVDPKAVRDVAKRKRLDAVYGRLLEGNETPAEAPSDDPERAA